jgi:recombination protein RecA
MPTTAKKKPRPRKDTPSPKQEDYAKVLLRELNKGNAQFPVAQLLGGEGAAVEVRGLISTQCPALDEAIGRPGYPLGRTIILHGMEGSGKTTLALHAVAEAQQRGGIAIYIDAEYKLDREYAKNIGVDIDNVLVVQPPYLERTFEYISRIIELSRDFQKKGELLPILVVLDSIDAMKAKAVVEGAWEDQHVAPEPRVWSEKFPKLVPQLARADVALLLISQVRSKVGVIFGKKDKTAGGNAPRFYCSLLMGVERIGSIKRGDEIIGNETRVYIGKNQIAPPFRTATFRILYGTGIDYEDSLLRLAVKKGVVEQNGGWYSMEGMRLGQGNDATVATLRGNPELKQSILEKIR